MSLTLDELVDTLLYEGYALYPYTPGATKNATPTPFGIVYPPAYAAGQPARRSTACGCSASSMGAAAASRRACASCSRPASAHAGVDARRRRAARRRVGTGSRSTRRAARTEAGFGAPARA